MSAPITIKGRIGKDPEIKFTPSNMAVVALSVVSNGRKQVNGQWQDVDTSWWECKAFGAYAEAIVDTIARGDLVTITGTIKQTVWVDKVYQRLVLGTSFSVPRTDIIPDQLFADATEWLHRIARRANRF